MSTESMQIAQTILQQIKAIDTLALWAWGAQQFIALSESDQGSTQNGEEIGKILGGVQFKIRTPKLLKGGKVCIYLMPNDTYTIRAVTINGTSIKEKGMLSDVYCDSLVEVIDSLIENKR